MIRSLRFVAFSFGIFVLSATAMNRAIAQPPAPPDDFPHFLVPGHEKELKSLRDLFWLHYPGAGPKATLWDGWLPAPSLWPAVGTNDSMNQMRAQWIAALDGRIFDAEGYVASHQHPSIAHQLGWPFPFWGQGTGGAGWHFSFKDTIGEGWRPKNLSTIEGWTLEGLTDAAIGEEGWKVNVAAPNGAFLLPEKDIDTYQAPFLQVRWRTEGTVPLHPYVEWITKDNPAWGTDRRFYFDPPAGPAISYAMIPMHKHPRWTGSISRIRLGLGNPAPGGAAILQAFFTQYDTRHNINDSLFVRGCASVFACTGDAAFLKRNINRMRTAIRYMMTEHHTLQEKVVMTTWVGHEGRSGIELGPNNEKKLKSGNGIGGNYWDLLPFGHKDAYATVIYYAALDSMIEIEREIAAHPEWGIPGGALAFSPDELAKHAAEVKAEANKIFWSDATGRFTTGLDIDGKSHDFGLTFLNLEAIYYGLATPEHAQSILTWIGGERVVDGDTSQGPDIYKWRFGPRATTKRNIDYYLWAWSSPESIPWGDQVQDGGAVLGFSFHDLMSRIAVRGPDSAWGRIHEISRWFDEVQAAGGYRAYYNGTREGTLQGSGKPGGLGMDSEFFESVLLPQVMIEGFLGFQAFGDGFKVDPRLPTEWPELTIDRIRWQNLILKIRATRDAIEIWRESSQPEPAFLRLPARATRMMDLAADGKPGPPQLLVRRPSDQAAQINGSAPGIRIELKPEDPKP